jgi:predicted nucleic acid-binding Zn ribbon protein
MLHVLRSLHQTHRDRQKRLAVGVAHIDELNRPYQDGAYCSLDDRSIQYTTAWEELFSKKEWRRVTLSHEGKCACCGSPVVLDATICKNCGAVWNEPADRQNLTSQLTFGSVSVILSILVGCLAVECFVYIVQDSGGIENSENTWRQEFVTFAASYTWISIAMLLVLLSTYIYE